MEQAVKISPETVGTMAREWIGIPLTEDDCRQVAQMLQSLGQETAALRQSELGDIDPAPVYDAGVPRR